MEDDPPDAGREEGEVEELAEEGRGDETVMIDDDLADQGRGEEDVGTFVDEDFPEDDGTVLRELERLEEPDGLVDEEAKEDLTELEDPPEEFLEEETTEDFDEVELFFEEGKDEEDVIKQHFATLPSQQGSNVIFKTTFLQAFGGKSDKSQTCGDDEGDDDNGLEDDAEKPDEEERLVEARLD